MVPFISWILVAFGQPAWISSFAPVAALVGYALFWKRAFASKRPFLLSFAWFAAVQAIQISWMTQTEYMGPFIIVVWLLLIVGIGLQFALLTWLAAKCKPLSLLACAALAGVWVLMEWMRLLPCTGFTWNPAGLAFSVPLLSMQAASLFGIYGLSFWVIFVNLAAVRAALVKTKQAGLAWAVAALFPFAFGAVQLGAHSEKGEELTALLVQPYLYPNERDLFPNQAQRWVPPLEQWDRILRLIEEVKPAALDLIALPECAVPFSAYWCVYPLDLVKTVWRQNYEKGSFERDFPPLGKEHSKWVDGEWRVSNAFLMQALANHYNCELIAGMDDADGKKRFNAAFHFRPGEKDKAAARYEKRILVPVGEYVPLGQWKTFSKWIGEQFGISDSFNPGEEPKLFYGRIPIGVSICMEEAYSSIIRQSCSRGAFLLVNLSNDGWFPRSRLAKQHFDHGIVRAVENGIPSVRACSTGVTGGVDCFGREIAILPSDQAGALFLRIPLMKIQTAYSVWGDAGILVFSCLCILTYVWEKIKKLRNLAI